MIKQTLCFDNPAYLSAKNEQLIIKTSDGREISRPIEDIGVVILDNPQITITQNAVIKLLQNNAAVIHCNEKHLPVGMLFNLDGNTLQSQKFKSQISATEVLKKNLWQQTVKAKIQNQAAVLKIAGKDSRRLDHLAKNVKPGDSGNYEAQAAIWYWNLVFSDYVENFSRIFTIGGVVNNMLDYGYAVMRAAVARALTGSGLLPTLGIFHRNQYNAYCLADDIMEPFRPFVDLAVLEILQENSIDSLQEINRGIKQKLLLVLQCDCFFKKEKSPLLVALTRTTASLCACFEGKKRKILYPEIKHEPKRDKSV
ncbi:MAG: type II CRISPR-associated endonuclease Cas1 [Chitinispirillales bacterium]|jgi:CRISPR-associated protein Cas1|nr:type II CRISPR-associated endonuclease Cas1 [Chitinispirillales bacterium]